MLRFLRPGCTLHNQFVTLRGEPMPKSAAASSEEHITELETVYTPTEMEGRTLYILLTQDEQNAINGVMRALLRMRRTTASQPAGPNLLNFQKPLQSAARLALIVAVQGAAIL